MEVVVDVVVVVFDFFRFWLFVAHFAYIGIQHAYPSRGLFDDFWHEERERECVYVCVSACVCVCEWVRERERGRERERVFFAKKESKRGKKKIRACEMESRVIWIMELPPLWTKREKRERWREIDRPNIWIQFILRKLIVNMLHCKHILNV